MVKGHLVVPEDILQETNTCLDADIQEPLPLSNLNRDGTVWSWQTVVLDHILKHYQDPLVKTFLETQFPPRGKREEVKTGMLERQKSITGRRPDLQAASVLTF